MPHLGLLPATGDDGNGTRRYLEGRGWSQFLSTCSTMMAPSRTSTSGVRWHHLLRVPGRKRTGHRGRGRYGDDEGEEIAGASRSGRPQPSRQGCRPEVEFLLSWTLESERALVLARCGRESVQEGK